MRNHLSGNAPALKRIPTLDAYREGLDFSDAEFVALGLRRINPLYPTGRAFLQSVRQCDLTDVSLRAHYAAVSSQRRLQMLHELNESVAQLATASSDRFLKFPELAHYDVEKKYEAALQVRETVAQKADRSVSPW